MSLFLPEHNAIFLHIPKCAGQSIEKALGYRHHHTHHKVNDLPDDIENYFRFTFVRHPVRRFISACKYNLRVALSTRRQLELADKNTLSPTKKYRLHLINTQPTYTSFADDLVNGKLKKMLTFMHQQHWLKKGRPQFVGRVENINTDFLILSNILNIKTRLQHANESNKLVDLGLLSKKDFRRVANYYSSDFIRTGYSRKFSSFN